MNAPFWDQKTLEIMAQPNEESREVLIQEVVGICPRTAAGLRNCVRLFKKRQAAGTLTQEQMDDLASCKRLYAQLEEGRNKADSL